MQIPIHRTAPPRPTLWQSRTRWLLIFAVALVWSLALAGVFSGKPLVNQGGVPQIILFWQAAFQPVLTPDFLWLTLNATLVTLAYGVIGTISSLLLGSILGLFASEVWWRSRWRRYPRLQRLPWTIIRALLAIPRGIHELLWGLFFINIFGLDPIVGILSIAIPFGANIAKIFSEMLDETDRKPYLALLNSGVSPLKAIAYTLVPAALADLVSYAFYRFECSIRAAAVLGVVGAGGLGYQILLSMQTLDYNETWTLFYALLLLSGLADAWSGQVRKRLGRVDVACEDFGNVRRDHQLAGPHFDRVLRRSIWGILLLGILSLVYLRPTWSLLWSPRTGMLLADIAERSWPLQLSFEGGLELLQLSQLTLAMAVLAAILAACGGWLFSFPAARTFFTADGVLAAAGNSWGWRFVSRALLTLTRFMLLLMRAVPAPIWALVLLFLFFPGMLPGALALAIYNMGVLGRLLAEVTENQDERPSRALRAVGAGGGAVFLYSLLPAVTPRYAAYSLYRWENSIRETIVVGVVGAGGIGRELSQQLSAFNYRAVLLLLICVVLLTFLVDLLSSRIRHSLRS